MEIYYFIVRVTERKGIVVCIIIQLPFFVINKNISFIQKTLDKKEVMDRSLGYPFLEIGPTTKNTIYFRLLFSV